MTSSSGSRPCTTWSLTGCRRGRRLIGFSLACVLAIPLGWWLKATLADSNLNVRSAPVQRGLTPTQQAEWNEWCEEGDEALALAQLGVPQLLVPGMLQPLWAEVAPVVSKALLEILAPGPARKPELGEPVAPFTLVDLAGKPYRIEQVLGKRPIVIELSSYS